ncbi:cation-transporting P-type ATPase [Legionella septentrionalis]|uniref:Cation-transporting P-type ATPase n=1 Tax=Legionella septentrionalis TaxID=2498109 RepID=A0A433JI06_9GAMM|nr:cation-transporting P-type ATPase [Legionella septentrionalis]RUQ84512.1 cation-transporting P-type ATPase [Legionella septentrionalis]
MESPENSKHAIWHAIEAEATLTALETTSMGLKDKEAQERLRIYGPNRLKELKKRGALRRFLMQFHNILIYLLLGAAIITAMMHHLIDTLVILAVILVNALIGFVQEGKAEKSIGAIRKMLSPTATVLREGQRRSITGESLVPGDVVLLEAGDKVPADLRLLKTHGLTIQEAILTGESIPIEKNINPVSANTPLGDRFCMAFSGTFVTNGQARGVVVATGQATELGRISGLLSSIETLTTPLVMQIGLFAKWLTTMILLFAILLLTYGYFIQRHDFSELFMIVVSLSVSAIPEGIPAVLSITLAIGVQAMAARHAIVRRLPAIETLGAVSVICTDKTGTLTLNEMAVASVVTCKSVFSVEGSGYEPAGAIKLREQTIDCGIHSVLLQIAWAAALCNDAVLREHAGNWTVEGDPMEGALLTFAAKAGVGLQEIRNIWPRTDTIPFDAKHRFMSTLHHNHLQHAFIFVKGAPEQILSMCITQQSDTGKEEPLNEAYWQEQLEKTAAKGQRVLAFAVKGIKAEHTVLEFAEVNTGLTLLGMVGLIDPPRPEAIAAVAECHRAGIQVKMITGDHASTALAIGQQIGLKNIRNVLTGAELDKMSDASLADSALKVDIFARTSPEHKLQLVMALQSHGMIVAMTGDGVNDAPALKRADAGIAMGKKGSEVAREAADLVLVDDNFASIVSAVREGRTVYDNLKKVISWTLPTNAGEAIIVILALLFGMNLPITPIQILWINLITTITLGIALAFEPTEENTMFRPPRARNEPLLSTVLVWHIILVSILFICCVFTIFFYALGQGYPLELARTMALNMVVVMEIFHLFFIRNMHGTSLTWKAVKGTKIVWLCVSIILLAQLAITYLPILQKAFVTEPVPIFAGALIIALGAIFFAILEIEKQLRLSIQRNHSDYSKTV